MNPTPTTGRGQARGRFIRGRARGGGAYRPYFYFRRNGRVIPARGQSHSNSNRGRSVSNIDGGSSPAPGPARPKPRGWNVKASSLDCSFLRPENYVAPEDGFGLQVQSFLVDSPSTHPGWRLYFLKDSYVPNSDLANRLMAVEAHYQRNPIKYNYADAGKRGFFSLSASTIVGDEQLKKDWPTLIDDLRMHPMRTLGTLGLAMHTVVVNHELDTKESNESQESSELDIVLQIIEEPMPTRKIYARPVNFVPVELINSIDNSRVDTLVSVRGIVRSVGEPTYGLSWQSFRCTRCQSEQAMRQRGTFAPRPYHCKKALCGAKDDFLALRSSPHTRLLVRQIIRIEESSLLQICDIEHNTPTESDVELRQDLVDSVIVGQEIVICGVLKLRELSELPSTSSGAPSGDMQSYIKAVGIQDACKVKREFSERDLGAIAAINAEPNSFKLLVQSLAPEVHGHEIPKAACLLSLFGASGSAMSEFNNKSANVLLIGDPGVGKSKIVHNCVQLSDRVAHINGKRGAQSAQKLGVSFGGRNKRVMESGALCVANKYGHCVLDDVDKIASKQLVLLQSMQSGEFNIPLPGLFATLVTQPSVIASANPQRGQYDPGRYLLQNIRLTAGLLKEFHLVYILLDNPSPERDQSLAAHVRALHAGFKNRKKISARYALKPRPNDSMGESTFYQNQSSMDSADLSVIQLDYDLNRLLQLTEEDDELDLLPPILMKKFIAYTRQSVHPLLNDQAIKSISEFFFKLRELSETEHGQSQIGTGQLLGLIHLSQARARLDLSNTVTNLHVRDIIALVSESIAQTSLITEHGGMAQGRGQAMMASSAGGSRNSQLRNFIHMLHLRSEAQCRRIFDYDELKEIAKRAGIMTGISQLVEIANMGGHILKKGPDMYELVPE
ncbi:uncharacterized protein Dwil_GK14479 [Drosophila willistoni]|uniref:MCM C-terminal AAA(+) ATPase domain-containing protein n=1 Tax=Drosophila willistoni TaxID=7260 RepID=B4NK66_DROWI|nr:DNA replication licensing factor REC [Drosophila willistoni]EDW85108.1 uncharacterized protein Dwil_GK14479 [Drosophila willistoni]